MPVRTNEQAQLAIGINQKKMNDTLKIKKIYAKFCISFLKGSCVLKSTVAGRNSTGNRRNESHRIIEC